MKVCFELTMSSFNLSLNSLTDRRYRALETSPNAVKHLDRCENNIYLILKLIQITRLFFRGYGKVTNKNNFKTTQTKMIQ